MLDTAQSLAAAQPTCLGQVLPFAAEAAWATGKFKILERFLQSDGASESHDFSTEIGKLFLALKNKDVATFDSLLSSLRTSIATGISSTSTMSLAMAHPLTIKLHALYEIEQIGAVKCNNATTDQIVERLGKRLDILGAYTTDKQYLLGVRRAAMQLSRQVFFSMSIIHTH
jgi:serine/threonine-protein kinase ATR